jgi:hypothetical protein
LIFLFISLFEDHLFIENHFLWLKYQLKLIFYAKNDWLINHTNRYSRDFESREESFGDLMRSFERRNNKGSLGISFINLMRSLEDFQFNFGSKIPLNLQIFFVRDSKGILEDFQLNFGSKIPLNLQIFFERDSKDI